MGIDFGRAPRGDPRMPHCSEGTFGTIFLVLQLSQMVCWGRQRILGVTELAPRKHDRYVFRSSANADAERVRPSVTAASLSTACALRCRHCAGCSGHHQHRRSTCRCAPLCAMCASRAAGWFARRHSRALVPTWRRSCRDYIAAVVKENKEKRQLALGQMPTRRVRKPDQKTGEKHGYGPAFYNDYVANTWTKKRMGPSY